MDAPTDDTIEPLFGETTNGKISVSSYRNHAHRTVPVFNRDQIDTSLFCKIFKSQKPVMLKGFMNNEWQGWTPHTLGELFGEQILTVFVSKDNRNFIDNDLMCQKIQLKGTEFFDTLFNDNMEEPAQRL